MHQPHRIAIIGAGISGITAAHVLSRSHQVTLYEKNDYLGGHTNTRIIDGPIDAGLPVDTGFIVCNEKNYPNFYAFLRQLQVPLRDSEMSFGFYCEQSKLQYMGPRIKDFLRTPGNLLNPGFIRMLLEQRRFNKLVLNDLECGNLQDVPLSEYLEMRSISPVLVENYLLPLIASIWSSPDRDALKFPFATFARFFNNHGMLELSKIPRWQTVVGGSHAYVKAFQKQYSGEVVLDAGVSGITRTDKVVRIACHGQAPREFDFVILATHADEAKSLLTDASPEETGLLGSWAYNKNRTVLHTDASILPPNKKLWASWNYCRKKEDQDRKRLSITYYMNKLQGLNSSRDYFVSLNCETLIDPTKILYQIDYTHPIYTPDSVRSQDGIRALNGRSRTFFCGAHLRYGFHEDGVSSALDVTKHFGLGL